LRVDILEKAVLFVLKAHQSTASKRTHFEHIIANAQRQNIHAVDILFDHLLNRTHTFWIAARVT
jgi:hypothetical protein